MVQMGRPFSQDLRNARAISMVMVSLKNYAWRFWFGLDDAWLPPYLAGFFFFSFSFFLFSASWFLVSLVSPSEEEEGEGETNEVEGEGVTSVSYGC